MLPAATTTHYASSPVDNSPLKTHCCYFLCAAAAYARSVYDS